MSKGLLLAYVGKAKDFNIQRMYIQNMKRRINYEINIKGNKTITIPSKLIKVLIKGFDKNEIIKKGEIKWN